MRPALALGVRLVEFFGGVAQAKRWRWIDLDVRVVADAHRTNTREHRIDRRHAGTAIDHVERGVERAGRDRDAVFVLGAELASGERGARDAPRGARDRGRELLEVAGLEIAERL